MVSEAGPRKDRMALVDLMVLIGTAAVAMGVFRAIIPILDWKSPWPNPWLAPPRGWTHQNIAIRILEAQVPLLPILCAWTIAIPVLQIRRRRQTWRRLLRQPGTSGSVAAMIGLALVSARLLILYGYKTAMSGWHGPQVGAWLDTYFTRLMAPVGMSVATAWALLALMGLWRAVPDTIDRMGRVVGVYWILVGLQWGGILDYIYQL